MRVHVCVLLLLLLLLLLLSLLLLSLLLLSLLLLLLLSDSCSGNRQASTHRRVQMLNRSVA